MNKETRAQRLRLLLIAGIAAPAAMALGGLALGLLPGGHIPDLTQPLTARDALIGAVTTAVSMGLVFLLYRVHPSFERALRQSGMKVGLEALDMAGYPVMLVMVTAAAFGEEILFRGGVQPLVGVVPAALLFGLSHGGWRREMWAYVVAASVSGAAFGFVYLWTENIWVPVTAHALHNILSTVLMGKKVDVAWDGWLPRVRLVPDPLADEDEDEQEDAVVQPAVEEVSTDVETGGEPDVRVDEPVSPEADSETTGADDRDPAERSPV